MNLNTLFSRQILASVLIAGSVLLSGCANTGSSSLNGNVDTRLTSGNEAEFFSKSGLQACAAAASVGVVGCMLSNSGNKARCAIIAGISACGVAIGANYYLDQRRVQYANTSERLHLMTQDVKQDSAKIVARTATVSQVIADDKALLAKVERD
ncbi:MAG: hypothetical protein ACTHXN_05215, partial [Oceanisphaera sp.]